MATSDLKLRYANSRNLRNSIDEIVVPMIDNSTKETIDERLESVILNRPIFEKIDFKMDGRMGKNFRKSIASRENSKFYYSKGLLF